MKHTLTGDGAPYEISSGLPIGGQIGAVRCGCGWISEVEYGSRAARRRAHAEHKGAAVITEVVAVKEEALGLLSGAAEEIVAETAEKADSEPPAPQPQASTPTNHLGILVPEMDHLTQVLLGHLEKVGANTLDSQYHKLLEEVEEWRDGYPLHELADVVVVAFTAAAVSGFGADALLAQVLRNMRRNGARTWGHDGKVGKHQ